MYFNQNNLIIKLYPERIYFNESMLNALLKYSLKEVMDNEIIHLNGIDFDNCPENLSILNNDYNIKKIGLDNKNRIKYGLYHNGKIIKRSIYKNKLEKYIENQKIYI